MKKVKVGIFIPPPVPKGHSASVRHSGIGRLPLTTQQKLTKIKKQTNLKIFFIGKFYF